MITFIIGYNILFAQDIFPSENYLFKELTEYSKYEITSDSIVARANYIITLLEDENKYNDTQFYTKEIDGQNYIVSSKTYLFGKICEKSCSDLGAIKFTDYVLTNIGSAEEELSFSFERIFKRNPKTILEIISELTNEQKDFIYEHIAWGFLNNRSCGIENPYEDIDGKAMIAFSDSVEIILNLTNYQEMFYSLNPSLPTLKKTYYKDLSQILEKIGAMLRWQEDYHNKNK